MLQVGTYQNNDRCPNAACFLNLTSADCGPDTNKHNTSMIDADRIFRTIELRKRLQTVTQIWDRLQQVTGVRVHAQFMPRPSAHMTFACNTFTCHSTTNCSSFESDRQHSDIRGLAHVMFFDESGSFSAFQ